MKHFHKTETPAAAAVTQLFNLRPASVSQKTDIEQ